MSGKNSNKSDYEDEIFENDSFEEDLTEEYDEEDTNSEYEPELSTKISRESLCQESENESENIKTEESIPENSEQEEVEEDEDEVQEDYIDNASSVEMDFTSNTPTSFNSDDHAFHLNFIPEPGSRSAMKGKNGNRKSFSFTNERMREIERHNRILLQRILTKKPTYENPFAKKANTFAPKNLPQPSRSSSAALNRKKQQMQIDRENQLLKRKIESIACRRPRKVA